MSKWDELLPRPKSRFLRVKCPDCGNEQLVFSSVASSVSCNICTRVLAKSTGGRSKIHGEVIDILE